MTPAPVQDITPSIITSLTLTSLPSYSLLTLPLVYKHTHLKKKFSLILTVFSLPPSLILIKTGVLHSELSTLTVLISPSPSLQPTTTAQDIPEAIFNFTDHQIQRTLLLDFVIRPFATPDSFGRFFLTSSLPHFRYLRRILLI